MARSWRAVAIWPHRCRPGGRGRSARHAGRASRESVACRVAAPSRYASVAPTDSPRSRIPGRDIPQGGMSGGFRASCPGWHSTAWPGPLVRPPRRKRDRRWRSDHGHGRKACAMSAVRSATRLFSRSMVSGSSRRHGGPGTARRRGFSSGWPAAAIRRRPRPASARPGCPRRSPSPRRRRAPGRRCPRHGGRLVSGHNLGDKPRLGFQGLPHIGVERSFGDVAVNRHFRRCSLPCRRMRPSRCSTSAGFHGASR